ncbi:hypothetical protein GCM10011339_43950 [Echinicola rosea]|uniref:Cbb3-type cytochrome oxidase component FixQ n=2 Tax=Cyclobacteriaceae TaxID=563798 RepID=A0ABQ1VD72_9BACT|nr:hypothetical protein GCM10011339_43950 [Echinicola rosea]
MLENITHGVGPQGQVDYIITAVALILVILALAFSLKFLIKPGEKSEKHIKNLILEDEYNGKS